MQQKIRLLFQETEETTKAGNKLKVTIITFDDPYCQNLNFVVEYRKQLPEGGLMHCFAVEKDELIPRFGIIYEGFRAEEIRKLVEVPAPAEAKDSVECKA